MIDLSPCDSATDCRPLLGPTRVERVLHIHLWTEGEPQTSLRNALAHLTDDAGGGYRRIDWTRFQNSIERDATILRVAEELRPTLVWMQLQTAGVVSPALISELRKISNPLIVSWCGDVGRDPAWSHALAPHVDAMLFSSMTQVEEHRALGFVNAAYLQIGYDEDVHQANPWPRPSASGAHFANRMNRVLFLGQNYRDASWNEFLPDHEAELRRNVIAELKRTQLLNLYGPGWHPRVPVIDRVQAAHEYRSAACALSISLTSKLKRYSSDRLFRALACGPVVLVKRFEEYGSLGLRHGVNCLLFDTPNEAVELASIVLREYERSASGWDLVGAAGAALAREYHTWTQRMREQAVYLEYLRSKL